MAGAGDQVLWCGGRRNASKTTQPKPSEARETHVLPISLGLQAMAPYAMPSVPVGSFILQHQDIITGQK